MKEAFLQDDSFLHKEREAETEEGDEDELGERTREQVHSSGRGSGLRLSDTERNVRENDGGRKEEESERRRRRRRD
ncbi:hypothetical protein PAMP_016845 [Pampus punctatissimus]